MKDVLAELKKANFDMFKVGVMQELAKDVAKKFFGSDFGGAFGAPPGGAPPAPAPAPQSAQMPAPAPNPAPAAAAPAPAPAARQSARTPQAANIVGRDWRAPNKGGAPIGTVHTWADGRRMKKVGPSHWVPVDQHDNPIAEEDYHHLDPAEEQRMLKIEGADQWMKFPGGKQPWEPVVGWQAEEGRGLPQEGELSPEEEQQAFVERGGKMHLEPWQAAVNVVNHLDPEKKQHMLDEINRGGAWGITIDGKLVLLSPDEAIRPPMNVVKLVRVYPKRAAGRGLALSMSLWQPGMMQRKELFVGEKFSEAIVSSEQALQDIKAGKYDESYAMMMLPAKRTPDGGWVKDKRPLTADEQAMAAEYKDRMIKHHETSITMLQEMQNAGAFGNDAFELKPDFVMSTDFVNKFGLPSYLSGGWEAYQKRYDKHINNIKKKGHDDYVLAYDKGGKQMKKMYYEAAGLFAQIHAQHRGILGSKHDSKVQSLIHKLDNMLRRNRFFVKPEVTGDGRVDQMKQMDLRNNELDYQQGGIHKQFIVKGNNGANGESTSGEDNKKAVRYRHIFSPMTGEFKGDGIGEVLPHNVNPSYQRGDISRNNVAYYQVASALQKTIIDHAMNDPEFVKQRKEFRDSFVKKEVAEYKKRQEAAGKAITPKGLDSAAARAASKAYAEFDKNNLPRDFQSIVAETVMHKTDHQDLGGKETWGALQADPQNRKVGNGNGFSVMGGISGAGRDIADKHQMATMLMMDIAMKNVGRVMDNTMADMAGNVMAIDNGTAFSHLAAPMWTQRNLQAISDYRVDKSTIEMFKNMTPDKLKAFGVDTERFNPNDKQVNRKAIAYDDLRLTAARMNGMGMFLEKSGGKFPSFDKMKKLDRSNPQYANEKFHTFEAYVEAPALKIIAEANTPYLQHLYTSAQTEYFANKHREQFVNSGAQGKAPEGAIMPPVYFNYIQNIRNKMRGV